MRPSLVTFAGVEIGSWAVERLETVAGAPLEPTSRLEVIEGKAGSRLDWRPAWVLRGVTSNERYGRAANVLSASGTCAIRSAHALISDWDSRGDARQVVRISKAKSLAHTAASRV
jgi:hypothetical protein